MSDREWLLQRRNGATDGEIESFCERVGLLLYSAGMMKHTWRDVHLARKQAIDLMDACA